METQRRYDLDWLRVLVFGLLIFYHVGMFFVPWGWHIKNETTYRWLQWPMIFVNQWRLPILFVISGMGTAYALGKRTTKQFIKERFMRLYIPLAFGMLVIIPPQVYLERLVAGEIEMSYFDFWFGSAFVGVYPEGNISWNHLWFLPYLLIFSLVLTPVFARLRTNLDGGLIEWLKRVVSSNPLKLYWLVLPLYLYESLVEPFFEVTHNLVWDWFNFISSLTLFFYGFVLISMKDVFWPAVIKVRKTALVVGVITFTVQVGIWLFLEDGFVVHFTEALVKTTNFWSWILVIFGYGAVWLNRPSERLKYANRAVYPFYILHQTITIIIGYYLIDVPWGLLPKATIMIVGTFGFSFLIYELLIRRVKLLHPLFGLKS